MSKYSLLIVGAMEEEVFPTIDFLNNDPNIKLINSSTTPVYQFKELFITVLKTGVGLINATQALTRHLVTMHSMGHSYDCILNVGAVAAINKDINLFEVCYPTKVAESGNPMTHPISFDIHGTIINRKGGNYPRFVRHLTGNYIYNNVSQLEEKYKDYDTFDMELYALAKVCWLYGEPFYSLKVVSDTGDDFEEEFMERVKEVGNIIAEEMKRIVYSL